MVKMDIKKFFLVSLSAFFLDQASKLLVRHFLGYGSSVSVIPKLLSIEMTKNTGIAFSIMQNINTVIIFIILIILGSILFFYDKLSQSSRVYFAVIFGSALGNLFDRIAYGYVVDFIKLSFWPVFNFADMMITLSTAILIYKVIIGKQNIITK